MEAPDKIFLPGDIDLVSVAILTLGNQPGDVEYVRKNTYDETIKTAEDHAYFAGKEKMREELLEWAKRLKERWEEPLMSKHSPGCVYMLEQLIDKLNSM